MYHIQPTITLKSHFNMTSLCLMPHSKVAELWVRTLWFGASCYLLIYNLQDFLLSKDCFIKRFMKGGIKQEQTLICIEHKECIFFLPCFHSTLSTSVTTYAINSNNIFTFLSPRARDYILFIFISQSNTVFSTWLAQRMLVKGISVNHV